MRRPAGHVERDPALFGQGEQGFGGFLGDQGQVDGLAGEVPAVAPAEQQQGLGEVDRPRVDGVQAFDEFTPVCGGVLAGDVEEGLRDRQRRAQLVGGVGGEPLLFGHVGFELFEHGVERVGELAELVVAAVQPDPVGQRAVGGRPRRVRDLAQRCEHAAGEEPASYQAEREQRQQRDGGGAAEDAGQQVPVGRDAEQAFFGVGHVTQQVQPRHGQQDGAGDEDEPGVAEGELQPDAVPRLPGHAPGPSAPPGR